MLFTTAESVLMILILSAVIERQKLVCSSLQLNQLTLILILSAVFKRQILVCSSLQLNQFILILSAVFERQNLVVLTAAESAYTDTDNERCYFATVLFALHCR